MRAVFSIVLVVGVALAGSAVYMTQKFFNQSQAELARERDLRAKTGPLVQIYAVNKVKKYGEVLTKDDVQMIFVQQSALPEHAFLKPEDLFPDDGKTPRYVSRQMEKFTPVLAETVTEPGKPAGLTGVLEKGESAFAVKVDMASGVAGFVNVGDRVDVYWTGSVGGNEQGEMTRLIEGGVRVVGVDQSSDASQVNDGVARTVTLAASREQVARLTQASATGKLNLALVTQDAAAADKIEVDSNKLLGITPEQAVVQAAPVQEKVCTIKTGKGVDIVETAIPCTN